MLRNLLERDWCRAAVGTLPLKPLPLHWKTFFSGGEVGIRSRPVPAPANHQANPGNMTPQRVLMVFTIMNRGGAETMVMNYYRHIDRRRLQFDFLVHGRPPAFMKRKSGNWAAGFTGCRPSPCPVWPHTGGRWRASLTNTRNTGWFTGTAPSWATGCTAKRPHGTSLSLRRMRTVPRWEWIKIPCSVFCSSI